MQIIDAGMVAFAAWHALKGKVAWPLTFQVPRMVKSMVVPAGDPYVLCWNGENLWKEERFPPYRERPEIWDHAGREDFDAMIEVLTALGAVQYFEERWEADEVIAALVHRFEGKERIVLRSDDKDFFQLLSPTTSMEGRVRKTVTHDQVKKILGVEPSLVADYLALTGDTADNIPRILTPTRAKVLLERHGPIRQWIDQLDRIDPAIVRILAEKRDQLLLNLELTDLSKDAVGEPPKPLLEGFGDYARARAVGNRADISWLTAEDLETAMAPLLELGEKTRRLLGV